MITLKPQRKEYSKTQKLPCSTGPFVSLDQEVCHVASSQIQQRVSCVLDPLFKTENVTMSLIESDSKISLHCRHKENLHRWFLSIFNTDYKIWRQWEITDSRIFVEMIVPEWAMNIPPHVIVQKTDVNKMTHATSCHSGRPQPKM